jgi:protein arginine N-methyltransferase 1
VIDTLPSEWVRVRVDGQEYVIVAACPHRKRRLVHGYVNVRKLRITCPLLPFPRSEPATTKKRASNA